MNRLSAAAPALLALSLSACLSGPGGPGGGDGKKGASASIRLVPKIEATQGAALARRGASSATADLESFQVAVEGVWLARDIQINGSAWNMPSAMVTLFENPGMDPGHGTVTPANAMDPSVAGHFIDFMTAEGINRLSTSAPFYRQEVGDYNFIIVNWAMPFKVKATIPVGGGVTVHTKAGTIDSSSPYGNWKTVASSSLLTGPSETSVVVKNNGGTWFRFLRPLSIKETDLTQTELVRDTSRRDSAGNVIDTLIRKGQLSVLLVFNPEALLTAWDSAASNGDHQEGDLVGAGGAGHIRVPYLDATAVPYRAGEEVWRETYVFEAPDPMHSGLTHRTRFELYTIGDNIVAATVRGLVGPAGELPIETSKIFFADAGAGGTFSFTDHARSPVVDGFRPLATVGATGTATLSLGGHTTLSGAPYTLTEKRRVN